MGYEIDPIWDAINPVFEIGVYKYMCTSKDICLVIYIYIYITYLGRHPGNNKSLNATGVGFTVGYHDVEKFKKSVRKFLLSVVPIACIVC